MRTGLLWNIICENFYFIIYLFFFQIWTSAQVNHRRATSTQHASIQWVHFHVPVMQDTLEMA